VNLQSRSSAGMRPSSPKWDESPPSGPWADRDEGSTELSPQRSARAQRHSGARVRAPGTSCRLLSGCGYSAEQIRSNCKALRDLRTGPSAPARPAALPRTSSAGAALPAAAS
jgi:hypothetical protein